MAFTVADYVLERLSPIGIPVVAWTCRRHPQLRSTQGRHQGVRFTGPCIQCEQGGFET